VPFVGNQCDDVTTDDDCDKQFEVEQTISSQSGQRNTFSHLPIKASASSPVVTSSLASVAFTPRKRATRPAYRRGLAAGAQRSLRWWVERGGRGAAAPVPGWSAAVPASGLPRDREL